MIDKLNILHKNKLNINNIEEEYKKLENKENKEK